jgi:hypothetical protein
MEIYEDKKMHTYTHHPRQIPLDIIPKDFHSTEKFQPAFWGLTVQRETQLSPLTPVSVIFHLNNQEIEAQGVVHNCRPQGKRWIMDIGFENYRDCYKARMAEQACHIENMNDTQRNSLENGKQKWIQRCSAHFPQIQTIH